MTAYTRRSAVPVLYVYGRRVRRHHFYLLLVNDRLRFLILSSLRHVIVAIRVRQFGLRFGARGSEQCFVVEAMLSENDDETLPSHHAQFMG